MILFPLIFACRNEKISCLSNMDKIAQQTEIIGLVDTIYVPNFNHGLKKIEIKIQEGQIYIHLQSYELDQTFYDEIEVQDSIIKRKGFLDMIIIKPNGLKKLYRFNCPDIPHDSL